MRPFQDRTEAGRVLADKLVSYAGRSDVLVLGLPRGGVPVAFEVARALDAPLDVCVVRKLGAPGHEELAMGAIASGGAWVLDRETTSALKISGRVLKEVAEREIQELRRRERAYRGDLPRVEVRGLTVILVDDGIATGSTMRAAIRALRRREPARIIAAAPMAAPQAVEELEGEADEVVCCIAPDPFLAVGFWYRDFAQTSDQEVRALLERASTRERMATG